jgi:hypothetical protein
MAATFFGTSMMKDVRIVAQDRYEVPWGFKVGRGGSFALASIWGCVDMKCRSPLAPTMPVLHLFLESLLLQIFVRHKRHEKRKEYS